MLPFIRSSLCCQFTDSKVPACCFNLVSYIKYVATGHGIFQDARWFYHQSKSFMIPFLTHPFHTVQNQWSCMNAVLPTTIIFLFKLLCKVNGALIHIALILTALLSHKACEIIYIGAVSPQFLFHAALIPYSHTRVCSSVNYRWICGYCQC